MAIVPVNELEKAMLAAAVDDSARAQFYRLLLDSNLVVLGTFGETMTLETVRGPAGDFHPVFTAAERITALTGEPRPYFTIPGRQLFEITRGASFVLNAGLVPSKTLAAEELEWCLKQFPPNPNLIVAQPKVFPTRLVKALCVLFTSRAAIQAAHLVYVAREGIDAEAHPMIGLETDGDEPRLAQEIFEAAAVALPGTPVEVIIIEPQGSHPLQKHLIGVPPFYRRAQNLN
jgi:hypothetical protein